MLLSSFLSLLLGCVEDGEVSGTYAAYLADASSDNLVKLRTGESTPDCAYGDGEDVFGDECYVQRAEADQTFADKYELAPVDCRGLYDSSGTDYTDAEVRDFLLRNVDYEAECCVESLDDDPSNDPDGNPLTREDCSQIYPRYFTFLTSYAYYLNTDTFGDDSDTYRVEAVLTSEHDLQLTIHKTTQFGDVRFGWVIDPNFNPQACEDDGQGGASLVQVDGGNWVDNWSSTAEDDGYKLYHLNSGAYQINPSNGTDAWYLDETWQAGYCFGRFGEEEFYCHATDYQDTHITDDYPYGAPMNYQTYAPTPYGILDTDCEQADSCDIFDSYNDLHDGIVANIETPTDYDGFPLAAMQEELNEYGKLPTDVLTPRIRVEENGWRPEKDSLAGLGGWGGMSSSWVKFKNTVDLTTLESGKQDTPLEGEFQIYLESVASASKLMVHGTFKVDNIRDDFYSVDPLEEITRAENNTPVCGETSETTEE